MTGIACSRENQISKESYYAFGGCLNSSLTKWHRPQYGTTYHHIGSGTLYWKQDKPKAPANSDRMAVINELAEMK